MPTKAHENIGVIKWRLISILALSAATVGPYVSSNQTEAHRLTAIVCACIAWGISDVLKTIARR